jgi:hypothetical protein
MRQVRADGVRAEACEIRIAVGLPQGYHLTEGAPSGWRAKVVSGGDGCVLTGDRGSLSDASSAASVNFAAREGWQGEVRVEMRIYFCRTSDLCLLDQVAFDVPIEARGGELEQAVLLEHVVPRP